MQWFDLTPHPVRSVGVELQIPGRIQVRCQEEADRPILGELRDALNEGQRQALDFLILDLLGDLEDQNAKAGILVVVLALDVEILAPCVSRSWSAGLDREAVGGDDLHPRLTGDDQEAGKEIKDSKAREDSHGGSPWIANRPGYQARRASSKAGPANCDIPVGGNGRHTDWLRSGTHRAEPAFLPTSRMTAVEPGIFSPATGSQRPPRFSARKASARALKSIRFSGRAKPWPSSG